MSRFNSARPSLSEVEQHQKLFDNRELRPLRYSACWAAFKDDDCEARVVNEGYWAALLTAIPGLKLNLAVPTGKIGTGSYLTWAGLKAFMSTYPDRIECICHAHQHIDLTNTVTFPDEASLETEFETAQALLRQNGMTYDFLVYPVGGNNELVRKVAKKYFRAASQGGTYTNLTPYNVAPFNQYGLVGMNLTDFGSSPPTFNQVKAKIDAALVANRHVLFRFTTHSQYWNRGGDTSALITDVYNYLVSLGVNIGTESECIDALGNVIDVGDHNNNYKKHFGILGHNGIHYAHSIGIDDRNYLYNFYSPPGDFPAGTVTYSIIGANYATSFPHAAAGILVTHRFGFAGTDFQLFYPYNYHNEVWKRLADATGLAWDGYFVPLTSMSSATADRPYDVYVGYHHFDTNLGYGIDVKTAGVREQDTLTITHTATASGNIRIGLSTGNVDVAVLAGDTIAQIEAALRSATFIGWKKVPATGALGATFDITAVAGALTAVTAHLNSARPWYGCGYRVGDILFIAGGAGGLVTVSAIDGLGGVTAVTILAAGSGYSSGTGAAVTPISAGGTFTLVKLTSGASSAATFTDVGSTGVTGTYNRDKIGVSCVWVDEIGAYQGSATYDAPSIAAGATTTTTITVTGAALGDFAVASAPVDLAGLVVTAYVSAANTVTVVLYNPTAGAIDLASGTWKAKVIKYFA